MTSTTNHEAIRNLIATAKADGASSAEPLLAQTADGLMVAVSPDQLAELAGVDLTRPEWLSGTETVFILRGCDKDLRSHNGFQWADVGGVTEAKDFRSTKSCGAGLHGFLWGVGDFDVACPSYAKFDDSPWLIVEARADEIVDLDGKVKFPRAHSAFRGSRGEAAIEMQKIVARLGRTEAVMFATSISAGNYGKATAGDSGTATAGEKGTATAGDYGKATAGDYGKATAGYYGKATAGNYGKATAGEKGTATAGYSGTATAGNYGTATAGNYGTATAGNSGTATAGDYGKATAGDYGTATAGEKGKATAGNYGKATAGDSGTATAGYSGTATAGNSGTATAGYYGTATAGDYGKATAGEKGTATAGNYGTATAGDYGKATAGEKGIVMISRWDEAAQRQRVTVGYVGEDGIKANTAYKLDDAGALVEANPVAAVVVTIAADVNVATVKEAA